MSYSFKSKFIKNSTLSLIIFASFIALILIIFSLNQSPKNPPINPNQGDKQVEQAAKDYETKYPIIRILPLLYANYSDDYSTYTEFRIDGGQFPDCKTEFCLKITDSTGGNYQIALDQIKQAGFNPSNYQIIYEQYQP